MRIRFIWIMQAMLFFVLACGCSVPFKVEGQAPGGTQAPSASLLSAIDFGSLEWVKEEIQNGADLNTAVTGNLLSHNVVPLQYAYENCLNPEVPDYLIRAGADLSFEDSQGNSLLFSAALRSDGVEWCQLLLEHGIDIDHTNKKGETALDVAAKEGYYSTSEFLLDNGAKVSQHTLELALQGVSGQGYEHLDLVQLILNRCSSSDVNDVLPISVVKAIEGNSQYLLDLGADDITALNSEYQKMLGYNLAAFGSKEAFAHCLDIGLSDIDWQLSPLDIAAQYGNTETLSWILENQHLFSDIGLSASSALYSAVSAGQYQTAKYLLDHAITVNFSSGQGESFSYLDLAAMSGNIDLFELLYEEGSPVSNSILISTYGIAVQKGKFEMAEVVLSHMDLSSLSDSEKETIWNNSFPCLNLLEICSDQGLSGPDGEMLINAVQLDRVDIIEFLLECGSEISYEALSSAVYLGYLDALKLMVSYGADVNLKETDMDSPILFTAAMSSANITNYLIEAGADVNASSADGMTALMLAVMHDRIPCAQELLAAGADPMFINEEGASAESIAKDKGNSAMLTLFSTYID